MIVEFLVLTLNQIGTQHLHDREWTKKAFKWLFIQPIHCDSSNKVLWPMNWVRDRSESTSSRPNRYRHWSDARLWSFPWPTPYIKWLVSNSIIRAWFDHLHVRPLCALKFRTSFHPNVFPLSSMLRIFYQLLKSVEWHSDRIVTMVVSRRLYFGLRLSSKHLQCLLELVSL